MIAVTFFRTSYLIVSPVCMSQTVVQKTAFLKRKLYLLKWQSKYLNDKPHGAVIKLLMYCAEDPEF